MQACALMCIGPNPQNQIRRSLRHLGYRVLLLQIVTRRSGSHSVFSLIFRTTAPLKFSVSTEKKASMAYYGGLIYLYKPRKIRSRKSLMSIISCSFLMSRTPSRILTWHSFCQSFFLFSATSIPASLACWKHPL